MAFNLNFGKWFGNFFNIERPYYIQQEINGNSTTTLIDCENLSNVYNEIPHLKSVINLKAQMVSNGIPELRSLKDDSLVEDKELMKLLENPNFLNNYKDFIFQLSVNEDIYGNAYIIKNQSSVRKYPTSMFVLPSGDVELELTGKLYRQTDIDGVIKGYRLITNNDKFTNEEIIRIKSEDNKSLIGESKVKGLRTQLSNIKNTYESRNILITERGANKIISFEQTGMKDGGMIVNTMTPLEKKEAERKLQENYGTQRGQRRTNITTQPIKVHDMSVNVQDLMLFEEIEDDFNVICNAFGMKRDLFANPNGSTFENQKNAEISTYNSTIITRANKYCETISNNFRLNEKGIYIKPNFEHVSALQEDEVNKAVTRQTEVNTVISMIQNGLIDVEQGKEILEL